VRPVPIGLTWFDRALRRASNRIPPCAIFCREHLQQNAQWHFISTEHQASKTRGNPDSENKSGPFGRIEQLRRERK
jgi:hypothetical protein